MSYLNTETKCVKRIAVDSEGGEGRGGKRREMCKANSGRFCWKGHYTFHSGIQVSRVWLDRYATPLYKVKQFQHTKK